MKFLTWLFDSTDYKFLYELAKETNESLAKQVGDQRRLEDLRLNKASGARFVFYKDKKGEFRWRLKSANHKILAEGGEGFKSRQGLEKSISNLRDIFTYVGIDDQIREK